MTVSDLQKIKCSTLIFFEIKSDLMSLKYNGPCFVKNNNKSIPRTLSKTSHDEIL